MNKSGSWKEWWVLAKQAASSWVDDYAPSMGAALSYYTVFSLAPMLLIVIAVAGLVFGQDAARGALFAQLSGMMGEDGAKAVQGLLAGVSTPSQGVVATVIGVAVLLFGATTVFGELQDALDRIWRAPAREKGGGLWSLLRTRFLSFGMILGIAFLLMVSLVASAGVAALGKWWSPIFGSWEVLAQAVTFVFGFVVTTLAFALIYRLMPRAKVQWRDVWIGAAVTSLLFSLGRFLISVYIGKSGVASGFGAAGSLILVFVWVYYSAQIFLMGAEFTWVYATTFGSMKGLGKGADAPAAGDEPANPADPASSTPPAPSVPQRDQGASVPPEQASPEPRATQPSWATRIMTSVLAGLAFRYVLLKVMRRQD